MPAKTAAPARPKLPPEVIPQAMKAAQHSCPGGDCIHGDALQANAPILASAMVATIENASPEEVFLRVFQLGFHIGYCSAEIVYGPPSKDAN